MTARYTTHVDAIETALAKVKKQIASLQVGGAVIRHQYTALHDYLESMEIEVPKEFYRGLTPRCEICRMRHNGNC